MNPAAISFAFAELALALNAVVWPLVARQPIGGFVALAAMWLAWVIYRRAQP